MRAAQVLAAAAEVGNLRLRPHANQVVPIMSSESPVPPAPRARSAPGLPLSSVDLLRALLEGSPDAIYFKDRESRFVMISRGLSRLLGLADPQEAYGKRDHDYFSPEHAEQALADERRIMETGEPVIDEVEKETWRDGRITWASSTKLPLRDATGRVVGTFGISRDITARKIAEQRLHQAQHELVEASRRAAVAEFAAGVFTQALGMLENAQIKTERIRRRAHRTSSDAMGTLAGRLTAQLANGTAEHQLAIELCALATTAAAEQKALVEDIDELHHTLRQLTRILALPQ